MLVASDRNKKGSLYGQADCGLARAYSGMRYARLVGTSCAAPGRRRGDGVDGVGLCCGYCGASCFGAPPGSAHSARRSASAAAGRLWCWRWIACRRDTSRSCQQRARSNSGGDRGSLPGLDAGSSPAADRALEWRRCGAGNCSRAHVDSFDERCGYFACGVAVWCSGWLDRAGRRCGAYRNWRGPANVARSATYSNIYPKGAALLS